MRFRQTTVLLLLTMVPSQVSARPPGEDGRSAAAAADALATLQVETAERLIQDLRQRHPNDGDVQMLAAYALFLRGAYAEAAAQFDAAATPGTRSGLVREPVDALSRVARDTTRGWTRHNDDSGRYQVAVAPGDDQLLVPYLLEVMEAADTQLSQDLGHHIPGPIRLELYPTPEALAAVSTLSVEDIQRTGTVALCKWDRIMVTTPRALLLGYPWADTLSHELVHLILTRATRNQAPVWFQEGVAKLLERRWRGAPAEPALSAGATAQLAAARASRSLIPFSRLHPSIARLESQEEAQLAFAQVASFFGMVVADSGLSAIQQALPDLAAGTDARAALANQTGKRWTALEGDWHESLAQLDAREHTPAVERLRFAQPDDPASPAMPLSPSTSAEARRLIRLGDLLRFRGHHRAAAVEYQKATALSPSDVALLLRYGQATVASEHVEGIAERIFEEAVRAHPTRASLWSLLGSIRVQRGHADAARRAFQRAIWIDPMDPAPHCQLATISEGSTQQREAAFCEATTGMPPGASAAAAN